MLLQKTQSTVTLLPLEFTSLLKRARWGGERLGTQLGKMIGLEGDYGESWELSDHPTAQTRIASGEYENRTLSELIQLNPAAIYGEGKYNATFPLLIKFLDATDRLSLQVHPDETYQKNNRAIEAGKSEAWVILDAAKGSHIYAGLKSGVNEIQLRRHLEQGTVEECLHHFPVQKGDCIFIPAGTLHAIGEGVLLAEIQQTSDTTFRLFDWDRLDQSGNPRPLHIAQALKCINFERGPVDLLQPRKRTEGVHQVEQLLDSPCFSINRHCSQHSIRLPAFNRAQVLIVLEGDGQLSCGTESYELFQGKTILIPATAPEAQIHANGEITFLEVIPA